MRGNLFVEWNWKKVNWDMISCASIRWIACEKNEKGEISKIRFMIPLDDDKEVILWALDQASRMVPLLSPGCWTCGKEVTTDNESTNCLNESVRHSR